MKILSILFTIVITILCSFSVSAQSVEQEKALQREAFKLDAKYQSHEINETQYNALFAELKQKALRGELEPIKYPAPMAKPAVVCTKPVAVENNADQKRTLIRRFEAKQISKAEMDKELAKLNGTGKGN